MKSLCVVHPKKLHQDSTLSASDGAIDRQISSEQENIKNVFGSLALYGLVSLINGGGKRLLMTTTLMLLFLTNVYV